MKLYGIGYFDSDSNHFIINEGESLYNSFEKAKEVFLVIMKTKDWIIEECETEARSDNGFVRCFKSKIIELDVE